jgi:peptidoglycan/LPS O-acetylase OafA/YrhL
MLAITCVLGRLLLAPSGQEQQALAATSAAFWFSNFHFAFANLDYFAPDAKTNLFLHTWSLGVEEQFYLIWPLLIVLGMGAWTGAKRPPTAARLKYIFAAVFALTLVLSIYWTWHAPPLAFYMMPARAWQFATGALVFLATGTPNFKIGTQLPNWWSLVAGWAGLALVVVSALTISGAMPYPGYLALLPTLGAALTLTAVSKTGQRYRANRWLATQPLQLIGRVSYSWYLWHWPVLLLGAQLVDIHDGWNRLLLVGASLLIASLSYRFFETPIRRYRKLLAKPVVAMFAGLTIMALAGLFASRWQQSALARMQEPEQEHYTAAHFDTPSIYATNCDSWYHSSQVEICAIGPKAAKHTAVVIGDSVGLQWFPAYARVFNRPDWRLLVLTKSSCPMVEIPFFYSRINRVYTVCDEWRQAALRDIVAWNPDIVVLGSTFTYPYTKRQWIDGTRDVLRALEGHAREIYIMRATPVLPFDGPSCLAPRSWLYRALSGRARCTAPAQTTQFNDIWRWLRASIQPFHNVRLIDMNSKVCPSDICHAELDGKIVYRDNMHMTAHFASSLSLAVGEALGFTGPVPSRPSSDITQLSEIQ